MISRAGIDLLMNRRHFLSRSAGGLGGIALASLMAEESSLEIDSTDPYRPRPSHHEANNRGTKKEKKGTPFRAFSRASSFLRAFRPQDALVFHRKTEG